MSLKQAIREALTGNDVEVFDKLVALRRECRERGIDADKVNELIRKVIHEDSKPAAMPEPGLEPITKESVPEQQGPTSETAKKVIPELSKRTRKSYEPEEGMTPSGTKKTGADGGRSIFDFIDNK